jgi:hypothetical protein
MTVSTLVILIKVMIDISTTMIVAKLVRTRKMIFDINDVFLMPFCCF